MLPVLADLTTVDVANGPRPALHVFVLRCVYWTVVRVAKSDGPLPVVKPGTTGRSGTVMGDTQQALQ